MPALGTFWAGVQIQLAKYVVSLLESNGYPPFERGEDRFCDLLLDRYGEELAGLSAPGLTHPVIDHLNRIVPLDLANEIVWRRQLTRYLAHCIDGGLIPDILTFDEVMKALYVTSKSNRKLDHFTNNAFCVKR